MSYTSAEYADGVWTHPTRTVDAGSPAPSSGTYIDDVAYAVWTYPTRTASGGVASFTITVAESLPAPSQGVTTQTVMPVTVAEAAPVPSQSSTLQTIMPVTVGQSMPTPIQAITAEATGEIFQITVNQAAPAPSQSGVLDTGAVKKPLGAGGPRGAWEYRPPIYAVRTRGNQTAPAPSQGIRAEYIATRIVQAPEPEPVTFVYSVSQRGLVPAQSIVVKSHRSVKAQRDEEEQLLLLLMGVA